MIKKIVIGVAAIAILLVASGYAYMSYYGMNPRADYETVAPKLPEFKRPTVLVFNKTNGFIHREAIPAADKMLTDVADSLGWDVFITNNGAIHNAKDLKRFEMVVWNNVSGDVLTEEQRADFKSWIENGGGWVGLHASGGDPEYQWPWYVEVLVGAQFVGHTMEPQFQDADIYAASKDQPLTEHIPAPWNVKKEEWYAFDQNPRDKGYEILLTIDEDSYITVGKTLFDMMDSMEGEHPIAWRHKIGQGKAFYSAIGHTAPSYGLPEYQELVRKAMVWAAE